MRIGILQCGDAPPELVADHGGYGAMVSRLVDGVGTPRVFDVTRGEYPAQAEAHDAYLITGSPAGVYEDHHWIAPLAGFLRVARGRTKMVGICFGHQMLAQTFGGTVRKSAKGWGIGVHSYAVVERAWWMDGDAPVAIPVSHQDQVEIAPPDAKVVLRSAFTPYAGLDYGDAISFQCHPEFGAAFGTALIETRRARYGAQADEAIASYAGPDDRARMTRWIATYLRG